MSRETVCFSWYSLMSMRTIARSASKRKSASARASSVLPTPVGPRNRNDPRHGHARPLAHDLGDVLLVDLLLQHLLARLELGQPGRRLLDLALQLGDEAVADLGGAVQVGLALELEPVVLELLLELTDLGDGFFLGLPMCLHPGDL